MKRIEKKTWPKLFEEIRKGNKTFDVRIADFNVTKGDMLVLLEWDPKTKKYTGRKIEKKVTFIFKTKGQKFWAKADIEKHGLQVIGFK